MTALSVGGKALTNAKGRKDVLSRGPDELIVVIDDQFEQALPQQTASALAAAAQKAGFDLIPLWRWFFRPLCPQVWSAGGRNPQYSGS